jgi:phosphatidylglycerophosphate synthase
MKIIVDIYRFLAKPFVNFFYFLNVHPNTVVLMGLLTSFFSSYLLSIGNLNFAGLFYIVSLILDHADGQLARKANKVTELGAYLDTISDRIRTPVFFVGIWFYFLNIEQTYFLIYVFTSCMIILTNEIIYYLFKSLKYKNLNFLSRILLFDFIGWVNNSVLFIFALFTNNLKIYLLVVTYLGFFHLLFKVIFSLNLISRKKE